MNIKQWLLKLAVRFSPESGKRFFVVSSLLPKMAETVDEKTLHNLNVALGITENVKTIEASAMFADEIWDDDTSKLIAKINATKDSRTGDSLLKDLYRRLPEYAKYDYTQFQKDYAVTKAIVTNPTV